MVEGMATLDDPLLPAARHLIGPGSTALLRTAVAAAGGDLRHARTEQVDYQPGHRVTVRCRARVSWGGGPTVEETLVACTASGALPSGAMVLEADGLEVAVWRYPFDPELPGLATAVTTDGIDEVVSGHLGPLTGVEVITYRPCRRAVVRASSGDDALYLKVVRPRRAMAMAATHTALAEAGLPVPEVVDVREDLGVVVLGALPGISLRQSVRSGGGPWPRAPALEELLLRLADADLPDPRPARRPPLAVVEANAELLAAVVPEAGPQLARVVAAIDPARVDETRGSGIVHGDLHDGQLTVDERGTLVGLLDLDGAGRGNAVDDRANLLGHLRSVALGLGPAHRRRAEGYATALEHHFATKTGLPELRRRSAATVLALAVGPFRVQERKWHRETLRRIGVAERLVSGEKNLTRAS
jgi:hypothetical protein